MNPLTRVARVERGIPELLLFWDCGCCCPVDVEEERLSAATASPFLAGGATGVHGNIEAAEGVGGAILPRCCFFCSARARRNTSSLRGYISNHSFLQYL